MRRKKEREETRISCTLGVTRERRKSDRSKMKRIAGQVRHPIARAADLETLDRADVHAKKNAKAGGRKGGNKVSEREERGGEGRRARRTRRERVVERGERGGSPLPPAAGEGDRVGEGEERSNVGVARGEIRGVIGKHNLRALEPASTNGSPMHVTVAFRTREVPYLVCCRSVATLFPSFRLSFSLLFSSLDDLFPLTTNVSCRVNPDSREKQ